MFFSVCFSPRVGFLNSLVVEFGYFWILISKNIEISSFDQNRKRFPLNPWSLSWLWILTRLQDKNILFLGILAGCSGVFFTKLCVNPNIIRLMVCRGPKEDCKCYGSFRGSISGIQLVLPSLDLFRSCSDKGGKCAFPALLRNYRYCAKKYTF